MVEKEDEEEEEEEKDDEDEKEETAAAAAGAEVAGAQIGARGGADALESLVQIDTLIEATVAPVEIASAAPSVPGVLRTALLSGADATETRPAV